MDVRSTFTLFALGLVVLARPWTAAAGNADRVVTIPDGIWEVEYPCAEATGVYADRCAQGTRDVFKLSVGHSGQKVCGSYMYTVQLGNHVDDGNLEEWKFTPIGRASLRIDFHFTGVIGQAMVKIKGDKLIWKLLNKQPKDEGELLAWSFWPPDSSILTRQKHDRTKPCNSM